jgi:hypothetical protein
MPMAPARTANAAYVFGSPIVHLANWRPARAAVSAGLRVLSPFTALGLGILTTNGLHGGDSSGSAGYRVTLVCLGLAIPVAVDAAFLAWKPKRRADPFGLRVSVNAWAATAVVAVGGEL